MEEGFWVLKLENHWGNNGPTLGPLWAMNYIQAFELGPSCPFWVNKWETDGNWYYLQQYTRE